MLCQSDIHPNDIQRIGLKSVTLNRSAEWNSTECYSVEWRLSKWHSSKWHSADRIEICDTQQISRMTLNRMLFRRLTIGIMIFIPVTFSKVDWELWHSFGQQNDTQENFIRWNDIWHNYIMQMTFSSAVYKLWKSID